MGLAHPGTDILTCPQLSDFLTTRCRALESAHCSKVDPTPQGSIFGQTSSRTQAQQTRRNQSYAAAQTSKAISSNAAVENTHCMAAVISRNSMLKAEESSYKKANCASTARGQGASARIARHKAGADCVVSCATPCFTLITRLEAPIHVIKNQARIKIHKSHQLHATIKFLLRLHWLQTPNHFIEFFGVMNQLRRSNILRWQG